MEMPKSVLTKDQKKKLTRVCWYLPYTLTIRHDDECGNGHNTFSMTYKSTDSCGHDPKLIAKLWPGYKHLLKWHGCTTEGPLHYLTNTIYLAGDRDCWGLQKGEKRQIVNGRTKLPCWRLVAIDQDGNEIPLHKTLDSIDSNTQPPCPYTIDYRPWCRIGEGKEPDLEGARSSAIWPDATLEQLQDKEALLARLPGLMEEFKRDVESLGFIY